MKIVMPIIRLITAVMIRTTTPLSAYTVYKLSERSRQIFTPEDKAMQSKLVRICKIELKG